MPRTPAALALSLALAAPAASAQPRAPVDWTGLWIVDQPTHAEYEATTYRFARNGTLALDRAYQSGFTPPAGAAPVGFVARGAVSCRFGARWSSAGATLRVDGVCSDGRARTIELSIAGDGSVGGAEPFMPSVLRVGDEPGWSHPRWPWRFRRCDADPAGACAEMDAYAPRR
ncbi:MAG: hypothetical protein U0324_14530 [Polyangiales bacterium]